MAQVVRTMLAVVLAVAVWPAFAAEPSRVPDQGCAWEKFEDFGLGIRLLVENCADPSMHYVFSANGDWLEQHRPSDDVTFGSHRVIRVMTKPADQPVEAAIRQQFDAALTDKVARASCKVVRATGTGVRGNGKILFEIVPSGAYAKQIRRELQKEPRDFGCGDYGKGQANLYFEYHPTESKTKYLWVDAGQDEPLFDQSSIEIVAK